MLFHQHVRADRLRNGEAPAHLVCIEQSGRDRHAAVHVRRLHHHGIAEGVRGAQGGLLVLDPDVGRHRNPGMAQHGGSGFLVARKPGADAGRPVGEGAFQPARPPAVAELEDVSRQFAHRKAEFVSGSHEARHVRGGRHLPAQRLDEVRQLFEVPRMVGAGRHQGEQPDHPRHRLDGDPVAPRQAGQGRDRPFRADADDPSRSGNRNVGRDLHAMHPMQEKAYRGGHRPAGRRRRKIEAIGRQSLGHHRPDRAQPLRFVRLLDGNDGDDRGVAQPIQVPGDQARPADQAQRPGSGRSAGPLRQSGSRQAIVPFTTRVHRSSPSVRRPGSGARYIAGSGRKLYRAARPDRIGWRARLSKPQAAHQSAKFCFQEPGSSCGSWCP